MRGPFNVMLRWWKDGNGDKVLRQDYEPVGLVSAAPMSGDWFHQHFGVSKGGLRLAAWHGPNNHPALKAGRPGEQMKDVWAIDVSKGGNAILALEISRTGERWNERTH